MVYVTIELNWIKFFVRNLLKFFPYILLSFSVHFHPFHYLPVRAATIVLKENNCHLLRVDKEHFNRILRDVEANTLRLQEHGKDVLVLERVAKQRGQHSAFK